MNIPGGIIIKRILILAAPILFIVFTGCANVQPWEREIMSDYMMRSDRDPLTNTLEEHFYSVRESATGGRSVGGGGCGCN